MNLEELINKLADILPDATVKIDRDTKELCIHTGLAKSSPRSNDLTKIDNLEVSAPTRTHYFATDGNYGDANGILLVNTENWLARDWVQIEDSTDSTRIQTAEAIAKKNSSRN